MQTRRKVVTYKSRNRRKRDQNDEPSQAPTSPLPEMDEDETTISEMNRRMEKRSRLLAASSGLDLSAIADTSKDPGPAKNSKRSRTVLAEGASGTSGPLSRVFHAELHANSFKTPLTSALPPGKHTSSGSLNHRSASSLSPVPLTKPVFNSRTKENFVTLQPQIDLASPFNSHPNSRNVSPTKSQSKHKPTKRPRAKSRTLSAHLSENREITASATDAAPSPDRKKAKTLHHGRNPSLPSFTVDESPEWLNYAGAKPRKPVRGSSRRNVRGSSRFISSASSSGSQPRPQFLPIHHSSFSLEQPLAFSTPPANRRFGRSPQDSVGWGNINLTQKFLDTDPEDDDEDVEMADAEAFTPDSASRAPRSTQTRRQTVRLSHDSLFSSMEISNSGSASTVTGIPTDAFGENSIVDQNMGKELSNRTALTSAMSLTGIIEPADADKLPTYNDAGGLGWMADDERVSSAFAEDRAKDRSTRKKPTASYLDDLDALGAKVSGMSLEVPPNRSSSMPSVAENNRAHREQKPLAGPSKNVAERVSRKRSDTIRASDYNADRLPQPKVVWLKPAPAPKRKVPTRKRSGTVTQRDYQASVRVCKDGKITQIDDGLPLSPQKVNESDDELLLK